MGSNVSIRVDPGYKTGFVTDLRAIQGLRPKSLDQSSPVLDEPEEQANQHRREAAEMLTKAISPTSVPASNGDLIEAAPRALPVPPAPMPAAPVTTAPFVSPSGQRAAPSVQVTFEVPVDDATSFSMEAWFDQVVRSQAALVFVSDQRVVGFPRAFPNLTPRAIHVKSSVFNGRTLVCQTTGISFEFLHYLLRILLITDELAEEE